MNVWERRGSQPRKAVAAAAGPHRRSEERVQDTSGGVGWHHPPQDPVWNDGRAPSGDVPQAVRFGGNPVIPVLFHFVGGRGGVNTAFFH